MNKLLTLLLFLYTISSQAMSFSEAQYLYAKIKIANGITNAPILKYSNSGKVNANSNFFAITLNKGILNFVHNESELAFIIGHELAHYKLGHMGSSYNNEYAADALGVTYSSNAGYSRCGGASILLRFHDYGSKTHPDSDKRYYKLCK